MALDDCIRAIRAAGFDLSEADARAIAEIVEAKLNARAADLDPPARAAEKAGEDAVVELLAAAAHSRRVEALTVLARDRARAQIAGMVSEGVDLREAFMAVLVGSIKGVGRARDSVSARRASLEAEWIGGLLADLTRDRPHILAMLRRDDDFLDDVVTEMYERRSDGNPGLTKNDDAIHAAKVMGEYAEATRLRLNEAGAILQRIEGWLPQYHNAARMMQVGKAAWVDAVFPRLDLERSFPEVAPDEARAALGEIYDAILLGRDRAFLLADRASGRVDAPPAHGPRDLTRALEQHRVLFFRSADDWRAYHAEFGAPGGTIFSGMLAHLGRAARVTSILEKLGPEPETTLSGLLDEARARVRSDETLSDPEKVKALKGLEADLQNPVGSGRIAKAFAEVMGDTLVPHNVNAAKIAAGVRAVVTMAKLGRAVLRSFPDIVTFSEGLRFQGRPIFAAYGDAFGELLAGKTQAEAREISFLLGTFYDDIIGGVASRWLIDDNLPGTMTKAVNGFFRLSGLTWWTERLRSGFVRVSAAWMAKQTDRSWSALDEGYRHVLGLHNIDAARWEAIRAARHREADGRLYVMPEGIMALPDRVIDPLISSEISAGQAVTATTTQATRERARRELASDLRAFFVDEADFAILKGDDRARVFQTQGTKPGTALGEMMRFIMQFKSWSILFTQKVLGRTLASGRRPDMTSIANLIVGMTAMGYLSEAAVAITVGKTPPDPSKPETIRRAFVTGGGAGLYGDFLLDAFSRFGITPLAQAAGPVIGDASRLATSFSQLLRGEGTKAGRGVFFTAMADIPYVNLWYAKGALDFLVLHALKESVSPGYIDRLERRAEEQGQDFILPLPN